MIKVVPALALFICACAKLPSGEDDAADSASDGDSEETSDVSEDMATCGPMPADFVCVPADSEFNLDNVCAAFYCRAICSGAICEVEEELECGSDHEAFYAAEPSQTCVDLLLTAETCQFGLACGELGESSCDLRAPCYPEWLAFHEAGCDTIAGIGPNCIWD